MSVAEIKKEIPSSPETSPKEKKKRGATGIFWSLALHVLMTIGIVAGYDHYFAQKIISLDIKGYMEEQKKLYLDGKINDDQFKQNIDRLEQRALKVPKRNVIIMGDAVIRNAEILDPK